MFISSITQNRTSRLFAVRMTLCSQNMLLRNVSIEHPDVNFFSVEPGSIYASDYKKILPSVADSAEIGAERVIKVIKNYDTVKMNGNMIAYDGSIYPF